MARDTTNVKNLLFFCSIKMFLRLYFEHTMNTVWNVNLYDGKIILPRILNQTDKTTKYLSLFSCR